MKRVILLILFFTYGYTIRAQQATYYVVADQDDWQLFMSNNLIADISAGPQGKVIIITLTAGDEGLGNGSLNGSPIPFYAAKERGAIYSSKFVRDFSNTSIPPFNNTYPLPTVQTVSFNGKSLTKYFYGDPGGYGTVVNYFFRLPDGGQNGDGFPGTGNQSLKRLKNGIIPTIASVDGVTTYTWAELVNTIYSIIFAEKGLDLQIWVNKSSLNTTTNPNDHSDHFFSSTAAQEAIVSRLWIGINEFVMDFSSNLTTPPSIFLTDEEYEQAAALFGMYNWGLISNRYPSKLNSTIRAWLPMESFSVIRTPIGNGPLPITLLDFTGSFKGNNVLLKWSTSAEINSKEFEIEKSSDGITYRKLHNIPAAGFSSSIKNYSYLDIEATELNYYRLKMIDLDGFNKLSDVVIIKNKDFADAIISVTNPFKDHINIRFAKTPKGEITLKLVDVTGKLIGTNKIFNPLSSIIRFDNSKALSTGIYILQIENQGKIFSIKIMKE